MIELKNDKLRFSFPEVHKDAIMTIDFQRTLRIPDDGKLYSLPPGFGGFPLRHVDDFAAKIPASWREHGGIMMPMFQSEAMWLNFRSSSRYPFLVKIATGKVNAVTGEEWKTGAHRDPQDYVVVPTQPWLDGYCFEKDEIRQFVAMPLGQGYSTEEQMTGKAEHGGIQIVVYPMKGKEWDKINREITIGRALFSYHENSLPCMIKNSMEMGLAPGGRMKQKIHVDPYEMNVGDLRHSSRCFAHLANSLTWRAITGEAPPTIPMTAAQYSKAGLPWFDHYSEVPAVAGGAKFDGVKTVKEMSEQKGETVLPENETATPEKIVVIKGNGPDVVREGSF